MTRTLVVVTGTGTEIGKTHLGQALLKALGQQVGRAIGLKPIETGIGGSAISDADRLDRASTFHVQHDGYYFAPPISPHLAAREAGVVIELDMVVSLVTSVRDSADVVLLELPGGLFSPLSDNTVNADLARAVSPDFTILVAPDRLGVLHEVGATVRAAGAAALSLDAIVLVEPAVGDASTGRNAAEIERLLAPPAVLALPRADVDMLTAHPTIVQLTSEILRRSADAAADAP